MTHDEQTPFNLTVILRDKRGTTKVKYTGVSRESLASDQITSSLLKLHDRFMPADTESRADPDSL